MTRNRVAWALLVPLLMTILWFASRAEWRSCPSVDCRTYLEMIRGVSEHGMPYLDNGPIELYPELRARWNVVFDGHLWGTYPPVFPYVASIPFMIGGLPGVARFNGLMLALLALGAFALGRKYTGDPLGGTAAAYISVVSTPASSASLDLGPYIMAVTTITWAAYFTLESLDQEGKRTSGHAFAAGAVGGLAVGTHLLNLPIMMTMLLVLFAAPVAGSPSVLPARLRGARYVELAPTRASIRRGTWAFVGVATPLALVALLNYRRFGSFNPISYGPCAWAVCEQGGLKYQTMGVMLRYSAPTLLWIALSFVAGWFARGSRRALVFIVLLSAASVLALPWLRERTSRIAAIFVSYLFDNSLFAMDPMKRPDDGLGNVFGPYVIKSVLQGTPFFALSLLTLFVDRRNRVATLNRVAQGMDQRNLAT